MTKQTIINKELIQEINTYGDLCKKGKTKYAECQKDRLIETFNELVEKEKQKWNQKSYYNKSYFKGFEHGAEATAIQSSEIKIAEIKEILEKEKKKWYAENNLDFEMYKAKWRKEYEEKIEKDLDLIFRRIGHQIKIHKHWVLKYSEKEIIKFVKEMGNQVRDKTEVLK